MIDDIHATTWAGTVFYFRDTFIESMFFVILDVFSGILSADASCDWQRGMQGGREAREGLKWWGPKCTFETDVIAT
jgi:hypothetical protein